MKNRTFLHRFERYYGPAFPDQPVLVDITETAAWLADDMDANVSHPFQRYPYLLSPWQIAWYQYTAPYNLRNLLGPSLTQRIGCCVLVEQTEDGFQQAVVSVLDGFQDRPILVSKIVVSLNKDGSLADESYDLYPSGHADDDWENMTEGDWAVVSAHLANPVFFACSLLHCKNVSLVDDRPENRVERRQRERAGLPEVRFKTLVIEPLREQIRRQGGSGSGVSRALHIVRGSFADYTEGPGLFGKLHGIYYRPQHVRGDASKGKIVKDYKLIP